jgi:hypothetical protein
MLLSAVASFVLREFMCPFLTLTQLVRREVLLAASARGELLIFEEGCSYFKFAQNTGGPSLVVGVEFHPVRHVIIFEQPHHLQVALRDENMLL